MRAVLAPKVLGTTLLAWLAAQHGCPMLVMSSLASLLGSPGQAAYAAANAALESISRAAGSTVTTIAWGPWDQVGMSRGLNSASGRGHCRPTNGSTRWRGYRWAGVPVTRCQIPLWQKAIPG
ncbi:short chain dehydrogenase family protein [Mycobacterium kansasii]|uniref:Short chain dehydrogenase family protein n=1 Tax=Mycobacterium kansasii TaxID=1768 RepID=A0A1V3X3E4_MYCKA|nr:short chain dehydrogenase family protein [Mycobacterium kansasii]